MKINAGNYWITIGHDAISELAADLQAPVYKAVKKFILVDENTAKHCLPYLLNECDALLDAEIIEIESGEENKNLDICYQIWKTLSDFGAERGSLVVNLGGGVITDLGGFVASTFKRGINFINVPTTLLAQVDASVGGKVGVDFEGLKNQIGVFADPRKVYIYPEFLDTLPEKHIKSGYGEMLKHGLIANREYWNNLTEQEISSHLIEQHIYTSVVIKNNIVSIDPLEKNERKSLNFGHTLGHAFESYSLQSDSEELLHGEAVLLGIIAESYISNVKAGLSAEELSEITTKILKIFPSIKNFKFDKDQILAICKHDKKNLENKIGFTLISEIGKASVGNYCEDDVITESMDFLIQKLNQEEE